ncbi:ABC transporter substrate-binding protein [Vandammella animalimorsus]|uniref:ABC transporter substrate-binding protein n=1 Tax=Vandammella animalimorsus TaxID=2029117 RepID=A0A2A2A969_9BURK|nr:ABC transporter substrate-binding protein [Vandammella animalimorsus]RRD66460.1 ABC transporter substrate-binding protein [Comamonadaceae bacterium OH2310_COT-174]PAT31096.1 ABC transporter substrate-binding protein [Vandammella animalimorsus]PAT34288.1 ABC transporter substrate-binding protein [Vandammella animalimorsus]PAX15885.1 ABC transporter substrate-binding protein [Vandammella animalimorsus]PAX17714.1 ABC transporter substrate-binding protein [Vandammella animalimorsus]
MLRKTFLRRSAAFVAAALAGALLGGGAAQAQAQVEVPFYFPVAVGGPITKIIDGYAADFMKEHPGILVKPIYAGTYQETIVKALTAHKSGTPPVTSVLLSTDMFTLIDEDAIVPFDDFAKSEAEQQWLKGFYPAFMLNSQTGGKTWGVPFQRSTVVMYWNKQAFKEAGLDPEQPPTTWAELKDMAAKLTKKDASGKVTQYGVQIPSSGFPYWLFQTLSTTNGVILANDTGNQVRFDDPKVIEALQYWVDLGKSGVHPQGVVEWGTTPKDFFEQKAAIIYTTTGNLTNIRNNAPFEFGVAMIPGNARKGSPTGGGNFYLFKKSTPEQQKAAFQFIHWMTQPERAAQWSIDTGYVATSAAAYDTPQLKQYTADFPPALVARDQLPHAVAEFSTHDNQRVTKALNDGLQAALTGTKTPEQAMKDAQREATRLLRGYQ